MVIGHYQVLETNQPIWLGSFPLRIVFIPVTNRLCGLCSGSSFSVDTEIKVFDDFNGLISIYDIKFTILGEIHDNNNDNN